MFRMNTQNGFWSYFWSSITGFMTMLTLQDVLFAFGAVVSALFAWLTYRSNDRKNKAAIEEDRKRTDILKAAYARGDVSNITEGAKIVRDIETELQPQDSINGATSKTT
ncbi:MULTISPECIES: SHOCT domain-containing protein [Lelliottia]|uniref:Holin n=1 Tax=Lelliottia wanjuensis TaxID=3050585 RepID=A0AAP4FX84_9ENTR|nr:MULTISPECIES: hypothetical protein [Lelliottia]MDK9365349.1 hypothetical protein [Lelliottia sp. V106_12]MDK9617882.1 hypothetical protein [Lelliottia sp. V106_9]